MKNRWRSTVLVAFLSYTMILTGTVGYITTCYPLFTQTTRQPACSIVLLAPQDFYFHTTTDSTINVYLGQGIYKCTSTEKTSAFRLEDGVCTRSPSDKITNDFRHCNNNNNQQQPVVRLQHTDPLPFGSLALVTTSASPWAVNQFTAVCLSSFGSNSLYS
jgi:hypothetical protein